MCWIIPLLVGLLSALLGYLLGKSKSGDTQVVAKLTEENNTLRSQLNDCENQKAQFLAGANTEKGNAKVAGFSAQADLSDDDVKKHGTYQSLQAKYQALQADAADSEQQSAIISELRAENQRIKQSLDICERNLADAQSSNSSSAQIASFAAGAVAGTAFDADAAKAVFGKKIKENDLTVVEGIGPKIAELFNNANISTWYALGETSVDDCQKILDNAGERFSIHNPGTWPRQAKLAANGEWKKLFDWQEELDGGKE